MSQDESHLLDSVEFELFCQTLDLARDLPIEEAYTELREVLTSMADSPLRQWALEQATDLLEVMHA